MHLEFNSKTSERRKKVIRKNILRKIRKLAENSSEKEDTEDLFQTDPIER